MSVRVPARWEGHHWVAPGGFPAHRDPNTMTRNEAFVGRDRQLDELVGYWREAEAGHGHFVVVSGEAGIGKTRLVERFATEIDEAGRVAWAACSGVNAPPLWPWRMVLRDLGQDAEADAPTGLITDSSDLVDPVGDQARRYAQLVDALRDAASRGPVLVVLDDLHWADSDSVTVLRMLAGEVRRLPLLLVATLRPDDMAAGSEELRGVLTDLASSTTVVHLGGLTPDATGRLVRELTGRQPTAALTAAIVDRTRGNPFFVRELMRLLVAEGTIDAAMTGERIRMPPLVRDVLLQRVAQFSRTTRAVLDAAAIAGREVSLIALGRFAGVTQEELVRAVDEAEAARLVQVVDGRLRFEHDLVREALVEDLGAVDRRRLHLAAGTRCARPAARVHRRPRSLGISSMRCRWATRPRRRKPRS